MNDYAQPITLSSQADWTSGTTFTVTGWGTLSVSMVSKHLVIVSSNICPSHDFLNTVKWSHS